MLGGLLLALILVGLVTASAAWLAWQAWTVWPAPLRAEAVEVEVPAGSSTREVARRWAEAGVAWPAWALELGLRAGGQAPRLRAGLYRFERGATLEALAGKMERGEEWLLSVRILEGWTVRQMRAALARADGLRAESASLDEAALMAALGRADQPAEGRFFPDTYTYRRGSSDLDLLRRALMAMQARLDAAWAERDPAGPLASPDEALVLASIVEKETGHADDRGPIAGVFHNRLRLDMPLQTDPTVIYGLGEAFDGNLRRRDLEADHPWNTYTRRGLPPTPIALPGEASLRAAVRPASTDALYFVARGEGRSAFSRTLAEHNRAVERFQRAPARAAAASAARPALAAASALPRPSPAASPAPPAAPPARTAPAATPAPASPAATPPAAPPQASPAAAASTP